MLIEMGRFTLTARLNKKEDSSQALAFLSLLLAHMNV